MLGGGFGVGFVGGERQWQAEVNKKCRSGDRHGWWDWGFVGSGFTHRGNILKLGLGAEPGEGFVGASLESEFGTSEDSVGFVYRGDVGAAGGRSAGLRPASVPVGRRGDPPRQTSAQWLAVAYQWFSWNGE